MLRESSGTDVENRWCNLEIARTPRFARPSTTALRAARSECDLAFSITFLTATRRGADCVYLARGAREPRSQAQANHACDATWRIARSGGRAAMPHACTLER
jgi:hypothetical protein